MNQPGPQTADTLLFDWESRPRRLAIFSFIAASLLVHALCFYVFQIVYRPTLVILPPPARVNLVTANSEEGRTLLRWIDAEDPALASATQRPPDARPRALPKLQHVPSYLSEEPQLKEIPPLTVDLRPPSAQPPGPAPMPRQQTRPTPIAVATKVFFSSEIAEWGEARFPAIKFSASTNEQPENVRFRVAINRNGEIQYCFALNSSGDAAMDEQARKHLVLARFSPRSAPPANSDQLIWGTATIEWGNDVRPAEPSTAPSP